MTRVVLDASAVIAAIGNEPGAQLVDAAAATAAISTVNLTEVQAKLIERGFGKDEAWNAALSFCNEVVAFDRHQARIAGDLRTSTRSLGLSLGDRACLALAITLGAPVYTTDRAWQTLDAGPKIRLLR
jgi:ribonuclease VapC